jgi:hypothetical protein
MVRAVIGGVRVARERECLLDMANSGHSCARSCAHISLRHRFQAPQILLITRRREAHLDVRHSSKVGRRQAGDVATRISCDVKPIPTFRSEDERDHLDACLPNADETGSVSPRSSAPPPPSPAGTREPVAAPRPSSAMGCSDPSAGPVNRGTFRRIYAHPDLA